MGMQLSTNGSLGAALSATDYCILYALSSCTPNRSPDLTKRFVSRLKEDGSGFEQVEEDVPANRIGGRRRDRRKAKAARKARKKNRKK